MEDQILALALIFSPLIGLLLGLAINDYYVYQDTHYADGEVDGNQ